MSRAALYRVRIYRMAGGMFRGHVVELVGEVGRSILKASPSPETELDEDPYGPPAGE